MELTHSNAAKNDPLQMKPRHDEQCPRVEPIHNPLTICTKDNCQDRLKHRNNFIVLVQVWGGGRWETQHHAPSQRRACNAMYKPSVRWECGRKVSAITKDMFEDEAANHVTLVTEKVGFRLNYLRQLTIRLFRCSVAFHREATMILETYPEKIGTILYNQFRAYLSSGLAFFLQLGEGVFAGVGIGCEGMRVGRTPYIKADLHEPNTGLHEIFNS